MDDREPVCYSYDGSFAGLLTCMDESFRRGEEPVGIYPPEDERISMYPRRRVSTDLIRARRFYRGIQESASRDAQQLVAHAFLTCLEDRERAIWQFLELARRKGPAVMYHLSDKRVVTLNRAVRSMAGEARQWRTAARFRDCNGLLWSAITPENRVLYLLRAHLCRRFSHETLLVYDSAHGEALLYREGKWRIRPAGALELPPERPGEEDCLRLWRSFDELWYPKRRRQREQGDEA